LHNVTAVTGFVLYHNRVNNRILWAARLWWRKAFFRINSGNNYNLTAYVIVFTSGFNVSGGISAHAGVAVVNQKNVKPGHVKAGTVTRF
jgi:hypothetical protein